MSMIEPNPSLAPSALVLCPDERMLRFLEIELAHLGLTVVTQLSPEQPPCLAIADTDIHPVDPLLTEILPPNCPLLAFGHTAVDIPEGRGIWLHRPFRLTTLESTLRRLSAEAVRTASPLGQRRTSTADEVIDTPPAPLRLDDSAALVSVGSHRVPLTPAESVLLRLLLDRRGEAVSRKELDALLGGGGNSVEVYICRLRRKIEKPLGRRLIHTVRGHGYRMD